MTEPTRVVAIVLSVKVAVVSCDVDVEATTSFEREDVAEVETRDDTSDATTATALETSVAELEPLFVSEEYDPRSLSLVRCQALWMSTGLTLPALKTGRPAPILERPPPRA
jgi:hypothetical protein